LQAHLRENQEAGGSSPAEPTQLEGRTRTMESEKRENGGLGERESEGELGERLRPGQMAQDAGAYVRETASRGAVEAWESLRVQFRDNPVPIAAVLGGGLVWYLMSRRESRGYADYARDRADGFLRRHRAGAAGSMARAGELGMHAASRASDVGAQVAARAGELGTQLAGRASDLGAQAAEGAREVSHRVREAGADLGARIQGRTGFGRRGLASLVDGGSVVSFLEQRPLVAGAAGFALGALVFGALRRRRTGRAEGGRGNGGELSAPTEPSGDEPARFGPDRGALAGTPGPEPGTPRMHSRGEASDTPRL